MLLSGAALAGIPFFSGFISKEAIFTALFHWRSDGSILKLLIFLLAFVVSFVTVLYTARLIYSVFFGNENKTAALPVAEAPQIMRAPIALLCFMSLWFVISLNPFAHTGWINEMNLPHVTSLTVFSIVWILLAVVVSVLILTKRRWLSSNTLYEAFYFNQMQKNLFVVPVASLSSISSQIDRRWIDGTLHALAYVQVTISHLAGWFDRSIIDGCVNGFASLSRLTGSFARSFQSGKIQLYVFWAIFTIIIFLIWSLI
jgi:NADH-quinone oxidoreductase subunit L